MPSTPLKGLYKFDSGDPAKSIEPGKVSEMILDFAEPLLNLEPGGPPDIKLLRNVLMMAELCWNLPVFETMDGGAYANHKKGFDAVVQAAPGPIANRLRQLIQDRKTRFAGVPFLVTVRVEEDAANNARVIAEARVPGLPAGRN